uniref:Uncharacterized protein n=1 Tax=Anguilla anguilla TaxID=7936 RepID=A0A0E9PJI1_ANGAN
MLFCVFTYFSRLICHHKGSSPTIDNSPRRTFNFICQ